jgi:hypothetical protein
MNRAFTPWVIVVLALGGCFAIGLTEALTRDDRAVSAAHRRDADDQALMDLMLHFAIMHAATGQLGLH